MNENINLCEILRNCPIGTEFYSPFVGYCKLMYIDSHVTVSGINNKVTLVLNPDATMYFCGINSFEIMLYPSKDQPDWSKWQCPKPKFDPSTLKPFDKVLVRGECKGSIWRCSLFSNYIDNSAYAYCTNSGSYKHCIPYNEDTKHLVGTTDEAPDFYKYWEDC